MDCSPPDSSVHGISQARILEWVAISFSRGSSWSRHQTWFSCICRRILYHFPLREALNSTLFWVPFVKLWWLFCFSFLSFFSFFFFFLALWILQLFSVNSQGLDLHFSVTVSLVFLPQIWHLFLSYCYHLCSSRPILAVIFKGTLPWIVYKYCF